MGRKDQQVAIRISAQHLARADALVTVLERIPEMEAVRVSRAAVLRLAILKGLDLMEQEHGLGGALPGAVGSQSESTSGREEISKGTNSRRRRIKKVVDDAVATGREQQDLSAQQPGEDWADADIDDSTGDEG